VSEKAPFRLFGIFGYPLSHTLSPAMQEAAFAAAGINAFYIALELDEKQFRQALSNKKLNLDGFNITVPHKRTAMRFLDEIRPEAKAIGAVNTAFRKNGKWAGANTDAGGFLRSLREEGRFQPRSKKAVVLGAGGAARAVVYALAQSGARQITVANRHEARARELVRDFKKLFPRVALKSAAANRLEALKEADLVVNATSLGLKKNDPPVLSAASIPAAGRKPKLFFDLIYHVPQTDFMKTAARKGHRVLNGTGMLLFQGAEAFEIWTGKKAPAEVMRRALLEALQHKGKA
jgi:shikimate dehydrogenase